MKIAVFGHKHIGTREGGIEVVVTELYQRIGQHHDVTVYDRWEIDNPPQQNVSEDVPYKIKKSPTFTNNKVNAVMASFFSTLQVLFGHFDVVHVHAEGPCVFLPLLKRKKIVVTVHGLDWKRAKWGKFASWYIKLGEKMLVKYADSVIVLSPDMQKYFLDTYGRDTLLIENGASITRDENTDELDKLGLRDKEYFLYTGRIVPEKRVDLLINAYLLSFRKEKLVIAGKLPDKIDDKMSYAFNEPNIVFADLAVGSKLNQLYTHAKLFILPSDLEGQSLSLLEALSYGIPCVISDIPENVKTAMEFGYLFKAGNIKELTEILKSENLTKEHNSKSQIQYIQSKHNWDDIARHTEEVYWHVIKN